MSGHPNAEAARRKATMIRSEDRLENPVTGEVLIFHRTSHDTDGEAVLVETIVHPNGCRFWVPRAIGQRRLLEDVLS
jgi:hypothetical protein